MGFAIASEANAPCLVKIKNGILVYHLDAVAIVSNNEHLFLLSKISGIGEIPSMLRNI